MDPLISMLNKIFGKHTAFNGFPDTAANFIRIFSLPWVSYIYATLLVAWSVSAFCFLFVCLFISLCGCNFVIASILSIFVSIYLDLFMFQRIENLHYNFTLI